MRRSARGEDRAGLRSLALLCFLAAPFPWASPRGAQSARSPSMLRVGRVVGTSVNHPTGDPNFAVLESFPSNLPYEEASPFLLSHEWGTAANHRLGSTRRILARRIGP